MEELKPSVRRGRPPFPSHRQTHKDKLKSEQPRSPPSLSLIPTRAADQQPPLCPSACQATPAQAAPAAQAVEEVAETEETAARGTEDQAEAAPSRQQINTAIRSSSPARPTGKSLLPLMSAAASSPRRTTLALPLGLPSSCLRRCQVDRAR